LEISQVARSYHTYITLIVFSERELTCRSRSRSLYVIARPSVCRLSVVCLSGTFVHPTQAIEIFGQLCNLVLWLSVDI